jgi:hypothetical protein
MTANSERHGKPLIKIFEMDITNEPGVIATAKAVKDLLDGSENSPKIFFIQLFKNEFSLI